MAYIVGALQTAAQPSGTSYAVSFPLGVAANDLLLVKLSQDGSAASFGVSASGFTELGTQTISGASSSQWFFKIAAGGETTATFACASDDIIATTLLIRDAHATAPFGATPTSGTDFVRSDWNSANSAASNKDGDLTTAVDECLLIYSWCADGAAQYMRCKLSEAVEIDKFNGGQINHIIGFNQQQTAGAAPTVTMYNHTAIEGGNGWVLAVRNKTGGALQPIPRVTATDVKWYGSWAAQHDSVTWQAPDQFAASINSITCSATGPTIDNTNFWTASGATYGAQTRITSTESTAGAWVGGTHAISSTDMTGKIFSFEWARNSLSSAPTTGAEGLIVGFSDGTNWVTYQVVSKDKSWPLSDPDRCFIALGNATAYASSGTIASAIGGCTRIAFFVHRIGSSGSGASFEIKNAILFDSVAITGGGSSKPATFLDLNTYVNSWSHYRVSLLQASSQVLVRTTVQLGDGTNATYFDGSAQSFEFPQAWSASSVANWQMNWNSLSNQAALSVKAKDGDTILLESGVAATDTAQNLTISSASAAAGDATYSFAQSFVGWRDPIDNKGLTWNGATFKECGTVTIAGGGDLTNCTIAKTTSSTAALSITANGTVITTSTISRLMNTGASATYHVSLGASVTSTTWNGTTLSDGTPEIYSALASGTLTITTDGAGTALVAADVTFVGGSTAVAVIAAPELYQSVAITGLAATYRLQIFDIEYDLTVSGITVTPTAGATYTHNGITWTVRSASITAGSGTITVYGTGTPATSGTLTKTGGTGDASVAFSAYAVGGTELYIGVPAATSYTWTDSVAAAAPRVIRVRVMEDGPSTGDAIEMIDAIVGQCGITDGTEAVGYLVAAVADDVYNDRGVDGSAITGITIDDATLRLEIASGTITNYNGTDVLVVDGRDLYAYETYWLGTTAGMRDEARFIEAIDAVNFRCSNFKLKGTSGYPIMINNCFIVDAATGIFSSMVDYSGDPISNHPEHMKAIVVTTSDSVVTGTLAEFIAAVPTANEVAQEVVNGITF